MTVVLSVGLMIGDGCAAFMGLNMGKGNTDKAAHGVGNAVILTVGFGVIFTILCEIFLEPLCWMFGATEQIVSIFGKQDELYMEFAHICMQRYMLLTFTVGASIVTGIFFQSIDKPVHSLVLSLLRQIVILVPAVLILGSLGEVVTVLWAGPISDGISCIVSNMLLDRYQIGTKKTELQKRIVMNSKKR